MNILENWGMKKIEVFYEKWDTQNYFTSTEHLFKSPVLRYGTFVAFVIGFVLTLPIIYMEIEWKIFDLNAFNPLNALFYGIGLLVLICLEFYLLFLLSFYLLSYYFYHLYHISPQENMMQERAFIAMMSRTVMELSEGHVQKFNIDHKELNDKQIALLALVYKMKVVVTNAVLKFVAKKALTRTSLRLYTPYVAALGTGLWDAFVFYRVIKDAQYKIMVRYTIRYLLEHKKYLVSQEYNIKAILSRYYHYGEYNNNLDYLLEEIYRCKVFDYKKTDFLKDEVYEKCDEDFLLLLFAFKEKIHSQKERKIIQRINKNKTIKSIRKALQQGDMAYLKGYIDRLT
ncbi:MAG: hypothetical protein U9O64_04725 [Campylobacterota bacterium]|nr:hypothetical protein [Campylobacterota bacterium]